MPMAILLAMMVAGGAASVMGGILVYVAGGARIRQLAILRRFSNPAEPVASPPGAAGIALRRDAAPGWGARLLPGRLMRDLPAFGAEMRRITLLLVLTVVTFVALTLYATIGLGPGAGVAAGLILAGVVWYFWARMRFRRRLMSIDNALPEAMDMIVRTLRVGLPISTAIQSVGKELAGPVAAEFTETANRISYGQLPAAALRDMAERCANQSLRFLAAAVAIQTTSGGNLAEIVERMADIARGRQQLQRKVRSITAEAKWSGRFLSAFPVVVAVALLAINPKYFDEISDKSFFMPLLGVVAVLLVLNILFMRWLVRIE